MSTLLKLSSIRIDGGTQLRAETNQDVIQGYAQDLLNGDIFPPVVVYYDGTDYWLSDGFHRYFAVGQIGKDEIEADIRQGTQRDAILYAAEANRKHGLPLNNKDKRCIAELFLSDPEWVRWSDREIARRTGLSNRFISTMRQEVSVNRSQMERIVERNGTTYTMNTASIGASSDQFEEDEAEEGKLLLSPEARELAEKWTRIYDEWFHWYFFRLILLRPDLRALQESLAGRFAYVKKRRLNPDEDHILHLMYGEIERFLGLGQYAVKVPRDDAPFILDWDAEEQELHMLVEQEKTATTGLVTIAYRMGKKLARFQEAWEFMEAVQAMDRLPEWVDTALHVGKIFREVQSLLTPEQFTCWCMAVNGARLEEKYVQALFAAIRRYEENPPVAEHEPDNQMRLAYAWYCCAVSSRKEQVEEVAS